MPQTTNTRLRVAFMLGSLNRGGTEVLALDVFREMGRKRRDLSPDPPEAAFDLVGLHRKDGVLRQDFIDTGCLFQRLSPRFPFDPLYLWHLRRWIKKRKIDVVHAQQILDARYARLALCGTGVKVVLTLHGFHHGADAKTDRMLRRLLRKLDTTVFVSAYQREVYLRDLKLDTSPEAVRTRVVYNGVSFEKLGPLPQNPQTSQKKSPTATFSTLTATSTPAPRLQLGTVGNFGPGRDQSSLCEFLHLLKNQGISFDFYFVGRQDPKEPWRYDNCLKYCQDHELTDCVHFLGARSDVPALLASWDAFLYATDHDTFGIAVVEAMAAGLPVFVNDFAVMREITHQGQWAQLYKTKDPAHLLQVFRAFLQDRTEARARAQEAARAVRQAYSLPRHLSALNHLYHSFFAELDQQA